MGFYFERKTALHLIVIITEDAGSAGTVCMNKLVVAMVTLKDKRAIGAEERVEFAVKKRTKQQTMDKDT